jgi:hypothetical protein
MSIEIGNYSFEGYYSSPSHFEEVAGIYAIFCRNYEKDVLIDIGESENVRLKVENNERSNCWRRTCASALGYAVLYTPNLDEKGRMKIEEEIRDQYNPVCGRE